MIERIGESQRMSQAVVARGIVYTSGQIGDGPDAATQTAAILAKIDALLQAAGTDKSYALTANIWLSDIANFKAMNAVWDAWVTPGSAPTRATVESRLAAPQFLVEIAVSALIPKH